MEQHPQEHRVNQDQARALVHEYLRAAGSEYLVIADLSEDTDYYEADIIDHNGSLVDKIRVNRATGTLESAYAGL